MPDHTHACPECGCCFCAEAVAFEGNPVPMPAPCPCCGADLEET